MVEEEEGKQQTCGGSGEGKIIEMLRRRKNKNNVKEEGKQ